VVAEGWFSPRRIADGLWLIAEPGHVSSWLVEGEDRALLFDTGLGIESIRSAAEALTRRPISVVNTHYHFDHVGGNPEFDDVSIHIDGAPLLRRRPNPAVLASYARAAEAPFPQAFDADGWTIEAQSPTATLAGGDRLETGKGAFTVIHTPGHSPDSICLLDEEEGWLVAGDTLDPSGLYLQYPDCDLQQYLESLKKLEELRDSMRLIVVGHGEQAIGETSLITETRQGVERILGGEAETVAQRDEFGNAILVAELGRLSFALPDPEAPAAPLSVDS
jgi:glyoxylase-like metal-dependent hydrolase (beta-lactamase superfamily II)